MVGTFQWSGVAEGLLWSYGLSGLGLGFQLELEELEWKLLLWDPLLCELLELEDRPEE
jgi:hypothetical protein